MSAISDTEISYQRAHINDNKTTQLVVANVIAISAATIAVVLRLVSRRLNKASFQADDFMIVVGLVSSISCSLTTR